jgi:GDPmannose 4,6-dehydratase
MLQQDKPDDYVVATGRTLLVRAHVGLNMENHVVVDARYMRPAEVDVLLGNATKTREKLGWSPETTLEMLVAEMVEADLARLKRHEHL